MAAQHQTRSKARHASFVLGLVFVLVASVGVPSARADSVAMACGGSNTYLYYSSVNFYLPYDGSIIQFAYRVGNGDWRYTDWHFSSPNRSSARWTGSAWSWYDHRLSDSSAQGQRVVGWYRYFNLSTGTASPFYYLNECGGGEVWIVG
jgi:hypothetical protein